MSGEAPTIAHPGDILKRRRRLPHWETPGGTYFVTFRLADSLPKPVVLAYREQSRLLARTFHNRPRCPDHLREEVRLYCRMIDRHLHEGMGACVLSDPRNAAVVVGAFE